MYKFFEETGQPCINHHIAKWGIVVGVRQATKQVQRRLDIHPELKGRVIALDTVLMTTAGSERHLRIFGTYALHDPGGQHGNKHDERLWKHVSNPCKAAQHAWIVAGNTNATLFQAEPQIPHNNQTRQSLLTVPTGSRCIRPLAYRRRY